MTYYFTVTQPQIIGQPVKGTTGQGGSVRISLSAPAEEGITIRMCINEGQIIFYASTSIPNPSSASHDWNTTIRAPQYQHALVCSTTFFSNLGSQNVMTQNVSPGKSTRRSKRQTAANSDEASNNNSNRVTLYITIEGQENFNDFSLNSSSGETNFGMCHKIHL